MYSRRKFLTHSCGLGVASATLSSSLLQLAFARSAAAQSVGDYRALVCVLLAGGNDSYNMLVPADNDQYAEYQGLRADLALAQNDLLALGGTHNGRSYAVHPNMTEVRDLYNDDELAFIANVGTLLEPFNLTAFANGSGQFPLGLFSHADQIAQWQTSVADDRIAQGWGGRIADLLGNQNLANGISMNISLSGTNVFQSGTQSTGYTIGYEGNGAEPLGSYDNGTNFGVFRKSIIDSLLEPEPDQIFRREYARRMRNAIDSQQVFTAALQDAPMISSSFSENPFSLSLRQIARTISARVALGATRQTFFVLVGGWDHHDEVLDNQARMLPIVSKGLKEFRDALVELDVFSDVTTFTTSDFGRTLTSNGRGSDHGWGGHHMVMGGGVNGGSIFGDYPELMPASPLDTGRGVYAPTTSVDQYFAELALWFGVPVSDLPTVLPNVGRFYTPDVNSPPLGFLL